MTVVEPTQGVGEVDVAASIEEARRELAAGNDKQAARLLTLPTRRTTRPPRRKSGAWHRKDGMQPAGSERRGGTRSFGSPTCDGRVSQRAGR